MPHRHDIKKCHTGISYVYVMKVSQLINSLQFFDENEDITFYFLKNDTLTNCQLETLFSTDMGLEFTIQDTIEVQS